MSFLPYGGGSAAGWTGAFGLSIALHGAALAAVLGGHAGFLGTPPDAPPPAPFIVTLAPPEADPVPPVESVPEPVLGAEPDPVPEPPDAVTAPDIPDPPQPDIRLPDPPAFEPPTLGTAPAGPGPALPGGPAPGGPTLAPTAGLPPAPEPEPGNSAQTAALAALIDRIRGTEAPSCLAALPRREGEEAAGLTLIASDAGAMAAYADALTEGAESPPVQTRVLVDPRQCAALDFLRAHPDYPATRLGIGLDRASLGPGDKLAGIVRGAAGQTLTLLMIDDNGVVHDLGRFLTYAGDLARFDVPVARSGTPRGTGQILIALATPAPPTTLTARAGQLAADVFTAAATRAVDAAPIAVVTVEIR